jgi:hypothetical protein
MQENIVKADILFGLSEAVLNLKMQQMTRQTVSPSAKWRIPIAHLVEVCDKRQSLGGGSRNIIY